MDCDVNLALCYLKAFYNLDLYSDTMKSSHLLAALHLYRTLLP